MIPGGNLLLAPLTVVLTYAGTAFNQTIKASAQAAGWDGVSAVKIIVNVTGDVGSTSTSTYALQTGTGFPAGMPPIDLNIKPSAHVVGCGGQGGRGGSVIDSTTGLGGSDGGPALRLDFPTRITNNGGIWSGGGGGAGGNGDNLDGSANGGGGGGGAGLNGGPGGGGGPASGTDIFGNSWAPAVGQPGDPGTITGGGAGGAGANSGTAAGGGGGIGGGPGQAGAYGGQGSRPGNPSNPPGNAGNYIVGNGFATWLVTGDVRGGVA